MDTSSSKTIGGRELAAEKAEVVVTGAVEEATDGLEAMATAAVVATVETATEQGKLMRASVLMAEGPGPSAAQDRTGNALCLT